MPGPGDNYENPISVAQRPLLAPGTLFSAGREQFQPRDINIVTRTAFIGYLTAGSFSRRFRTRLTPFPSRSLSPSTAQNCTCVPAISTIFQLPSSQRLHHDADDDAARAISIRVYLDLNKACLRAEHAYLLPLRDSNQSASGSLTRCSSR